MGEKRGPALMFAMTHLQLQLCKWREKGKKRRREGCLSAPLNVVWCRLERPEIVIVRREGKREDRGSGGRPEFCLYFEIFQPGEKGEREEKIIDLQPTTNSRCRTRCRINIGRKGGKRKREGRSILHHTHIISGG